LTANRAHWPFQSGYFTSSAARAPPIVIIVSARVSAIPIVPVELRSNMISSLRVSDGLIDRGRRHVRASVNRIHGRRRARKGTPSERVARISLALDPGYAGLVLKSFGLIRYSLRPDHARLQFEKAVCCSERDPTP
jgi:hypothetical protein